MGKMQATDEMLYKYMPIVDEAIIEELEKETDYDYRFSDQFQMKMKWLIWRERHMDMRRFCRKYGSRVAIFAVLLLAVGIAVAMRVEGEHVEFFAKLAHPDSSFDDTSAAADEEAKAVLTEPGYVPEGYVLASEDINNQWMFWIYENETLGRELTLIRDKVVDAEKKETDTEYDFSEEIELECGMIEVHGYNGGYVFACFEFENYSYTLKGADLDLEEIKKIYENWIY
ncbi:MAG: DUF4367 domain-containing protein [Blautia sp.]|nr:DUF4367 domain-containing protein [Blautia sp.]